MSFAPDDDFKIRDAIKGHLQNGCELILLSGGMSVDPDDVTRRGIRMAGAEEFHYGAAVLPGAMFLVSYINQTPVLGVPACGLHHKTTVLDLLLPRILSGEKIGEKGTGIFRARWTLHGLSPMPLSSVPIRKRWSSQRTK